MEIYGWYKNLIYSRGKRWPFGFYSHLKPLNTHFQNICYMDRKVDPCEKRTKYDWKQLDFALPNVLQSRWARKTALIWIWMDAINFIQEARKCGNVHRECICTSVNDMDCVASQYYISKSTIQIQYPQYKYLYTNIHRAIAMAGLHSWYGDFEKAPEIGIYVMWLSIQTSPSITTHNEICMKKYVRCALSSIVNPEKIHERIARSSDNRFILYSFIAANASASRL